jgi:hypothetical protein
MRTLIFLVTNLDLPDAACYWYKFRKGFVKAPKQSASQLFKPIRLTPYWI